MYRPLYFFGNNTNTNVSHQLLAVARQRQPVYSNGGKTVSITMKGWEWSNGETVDANSVQFFLTHGDGQEGELVRVRARPAAGQHHVGHGQREHAHAAAQQGLLQSIWYTYNQLAELNPMPEAWDVTSLGAQAGQRRLPTDSAADGWAKCKAVKGVPDRPVEDRLRPTRPARCGRWSTGRGSCPASAPPATSRWCRTPSTPAPRSRSCRNQVRAVHRRRDRVHRAEDRAARHRLHPLGGPAAEDGELGRADDQPAGQRLQPAALLLRSASSTPSPTSTTRRSASWSASSTCGRPCRRSSTSPASSRRSCAGTPSRTRDRPRTAAGEPVDTFRPDRERQSGPVPVQRRQGEVVAGEPRLVRGGRRDDLPGPVQVRRRHHQGPAGEVHVHLLDR